MGHDYYIASCVFTSRFPELSHAIRMYMGDVLGLRVVRCCVPKYKLKSFTEMMPQGELREEWQSLPDSAAFQAGDTVYSLCHNCSAIIEEQHPQVRNLSIWELLLKDASFPFPHYNGVKMAVQDCWRAKERRDEQEAVRQLLRLMDIEPVELPNHHEKTEFCGISLLRPAPPRNLKLAPRRFVEHAAGMFQPHTSEEQKANMLSYAATLPALPVVTYCHYCFEGLELAGIDTRHLAAMLFKTN